MRCLKSIPVSEDIQVVVVDDNSPDADSYLERYPELSRPYLEFIRTTKGGGAGYARNVGLDHAKGNGCCSPIVMISLWIICSISFCHMSIRKLI